MELPENTWKLNGISQKAKTVAQMAAPAAGMTLGAWLCQIIRQTAAAENQAALQSKQENALTPSENMDLNPISQRESDDHEPAPPPM